MRQQDVSPGQMRASVQRQQKRSVNVSDLLASPTFLQSLTPTERSDLLRPQAHGSTTAPSSPTTGRSKSKDNLRDSRQVQHLQLDVAQLHAGPLWPLTWPTAGSPRACADNTPGAKGDRQQLLQDSMCLLEHREQLQQQVEDLEQQLAVMQSQQRQRQQQQQQLPPDPAVGSVISGLRASMAQVSSVASQVTQENKLLAAENNRLTQLYRQQAGTLKQMQSRVKQLEGNLLQQLEESSRDSLQQVGAVAVGTQLDALLTPELLAASQPTGSSSTAGSPLLVEVAGSSDSKVRPLLHQTATLRRAQQNLQRQVAQLQQQLSDAERDAQAAAVAAAADKAHARRTITQAHQRLSAALQRLKALADRQQQQSAGLQEREAYIARLEKCLVQQNELIRLASSAAASSKGGRSLRNRHCGSSRANAGRVPVEGLLVALEAGMEAGGHRDGAQGFPASCSAQHRQDPGLGTPQQQQQHDTVPPESQLGQHRHWHSPTQKLSPQQQLPQQEQHSSVHVRAWHEHVPQQQQQQQADSHSRPGSPHERRVLPQVCPQALASSRAAVALQCREIMAHAGAEAEAGAEEEAVLPAAAATAGAREDVRGSRSPGRGKSPSLQRNGPAAAAAALPSFTAAAGRMQRTAAAKGQQQRHNSSSRGSASAGTAAKKIAAAAAAVAALDTNTRGLWGNTTTLAPSPTQPAGRLVLQQQRQRRLRELLQQKQQRHPQHSSQQQQQQGVRAPQAAVDAAAGPQLPAEERFWLSARQAAATEGYWQQPQQPGAEGGIRNVEGEGDIVHEQFAEEEAHQEEELHAAQRVLQHQQLQRQSSASSAGAEDSAAEHCTGSDSNSCGSSRAGSPRQQVQPLAVAAVSASTTALLHRSLSTSSKQLSPRSEGDGSIMSEMLMMQQNLHELEEDLMQLGCGFET